MSSLLKSTLAACGLALAAAAVCIPSSALAADIKKPATKSKKPTAKPSPTAITPEAEPDTAGSVSTEFKCELGNAVTIYANEADADHIALRWKQRLHRLTRVVTSTGANRFENANYGLIWIGIPAKGMLLDSKQNRQLANECKNAEQMMPPAADAPKA